MIKTIRFSAKDTSSKAAKHCRHLTSAWVITAQDIIQLRAEKDDKDAQKAKNAKQSDIVTSPGMSLDSVV